MSLDSEWETTSGLPLDGATATIIAMEFGYNASIGAGVVCANMTFLTDEEDGEGQEIEQSFSVGSRGEPSRDGTELVGGPAKFPARTNYGRLLDSVRELVDHPGDVIGSPKKAEGWIGTKWTIGTVAVESTNPNAADPEKATKVSDKFIFTAYHGKEGTKTAKAGAAKKSAAKPAKAAPEPDEPDETADDNDGSDEPWSVLGVDEALWKKLVKIAKASDSHDEFSDTALEIKEVDSDKAAQKAVLTTKPGSVWHFVNGDG